MGEREEWGQRCNLSKAKTHASLKFALSVVELNCPRGGRSPVWKCSKQPPPGPPVKWSVLVEPE